MTTQSLISAAQAPRASHDPYVRDGDNPSRSEHDNKAVFGDHSYQCAASSLEHGKLVLKTSEFYVGRDDNGRITYGVSPNHTSTARPVGGKANSDNPKSSREDGPSNFDSCQKGAASVATYPINEIFTNPKNQTVYSQGELNQQTTKQPKQQTTKQPKQQTTKQPKQQTKNVFSDFAYDPPSNKNNNFETGSQNLSRYNYTDYLVSKTGNTQLTDFKPKPLAKKACFFGGSEKYPLRSELVIQPRMDHYFVKEREEITPNHFLTKLCLRHSDLDRHDVNDNAPAAIPAAQRSRAAAIVAESAGDNDGAVTKREFFMQNLKETGFVVFSSDLTRFSGGMKYPLPNKKAMANRIGKGGNGFVFTIFHNGKEYAVKKTVYRKNEFELHSNLNHANLVNLDAALIGDRHEKSRDKFYCFYFMTKCDLDFRSVISTKEHGCLKHLKTRISNQPDNWQLVTVNVKYVLRSVLKALDYMHGQGLVHRDVKASNILLKKHCKCEDMLLCACPKKYAVKLGDFDSSTTVPGYGVEIGPDSIIRYASILALGTIGYRAPEVCMNVVLSGPYEVLYTTAVDIWSFGCLVLNILIGKSGPLKQRGEASLLLSAQEQPYAEPLYNKIIKLKELRKYYGDMPQLVDLVVKCLQVKAHCRLSAKGLLELDVMKFDNPAVQEDPA